MTEPPVPSPAEPADVIDALLGIRPGDRLDRLRARRPQARENAQRSFELLMQPADLSEASRFERDLVAAFVAGVHAVPSAESFYASRLASHGDEASAQVLAAEVERGRTTGPYGRYREAGLVEESVEGARYRASETAAVVLGPRAAAALEHAHLLVFRPRESSPEALDALLAAGWSTTGIVTLSQLIAFLAFQLRVVAGLTALAAASTDPSGTADGEED